MVWENGHTLVCSCTCVKFRQQRKKSSQVIQSNQAGLTYLLGEFLFLRQVYREISLIICAPELACMNVSLFPLRVLDKLLNCALNLRVVTVAGLLLLVKSNKRICEENDFLGAFCLFVWVFLWRNFAWWGKKRIFLD